MRAGSPSTLELVPELSGGTEVSLGGSARYSVEWSRESGAIRVVPSRLLGSLARRDFCFCAVSRKQLSARPKTGRRAPAAPSERVLRLVDKMTKWSEAREANKVLDVSLIPAVRDRAVSAAGRVPVVASRRERYLHRGSPDATLPDLLLI